MYDTVDEIQQKLGSCVLLYDNRPVFVRGPAANTAIQVFFCDDLGRTLFNVELSDPKLDYRNLGEHLGYTRVDLYGSIPYNEVVYLMRMPVRKSVQGLHEVNVCVSELRGNQKKDIPPSHGSFGAWLYAKNSKHFMDMIHNKYPTLGEVSKDFENPDVISRAFTRHWAVFRDPVGPFQLMYKDRRVGYTEDFHRLVVADRFKYLQRELAA